MSPDDTGADLFVDALLDYGVTHVFGNPGTTELPIMRALADSDLEYVLSLHEDVAVGAAAGYASTRRYRSHRDESVLPVGVVNLHVAPGLAHGLGNLYDAMIAGAPLVVTAGNHSTDFRHEEPILSGDLRSMAADFCKWSDEVRDVAALPTMLRRAFRVALTPPTGPVFLALPLDVMMAETTADPERLGPIPSAGAGDAGDLDRAADLLADADDPVLVLGDEVARAGRGAIDGAVALAEATGARVHAEILASEVNFPLDHEQWLSFLPTREKQIQRLQDTDTLVFAGCSTNTTLVRHDTPLVPADATCIHLGPDAWELGKNEPADATVIGGLTEILPALADRAAVRIDGATVDERLRRVAGAKATLAERLAESAEADASDDGRGLSKTELADALAAGAPDAFVVDEGITARKALLTRYPFSPEQLIGNKGGGLGYGVPAALGAALAEAQRDASRSVVCFVGDGSYLYYPNALYTAARYDLDITFVVVDNRNYRILKDNTIALFGGDDAAHTYVGMDFEPPVDIPANAASYGVESDLVDTTSVDEAAAAIEGAVGQDGPRLLDVIVHD
ncbi:thiamine pyrophosphate-binding protein [Haloferacaceae archaeon DSL9]